MENYKVGGLFSGIGGIELGFEKSGFQVSWANEYDKYSCQTYRENFKHKLIEDDIHNLNGKSLEPVDVLTGGFPCQAFSIAGHRKGFDDKRGNLFFQIMRLVDEMDSKPNVLFLENVKNFKGHDNGNTFKVVSEEIQNRGYSFFSDVLNTATYTNIPQNRERIFMIGFKDEANWMFDNDRIKTASHLFDQIFPPQPSKTRKNVQDMLEKRKVDEKYYYDESKYMYDELKENMKSRDTVYQWRRKYVRENKSNLCNTLTANMGTGGHNVPLIIDDYGFRKLTPRECFSFQGFPKSYKIPNEVSNGRLYKQAGNAVSVPLITKLANSIKQSLDHRFSQV